MINIYRDPMTAADIKAARKEVANGQKFEDSTAFKVFAYCPIPVVDVLAGITTHAVSSMLTDDPMDQLKSVHGASRRDWSASDTTNDYVKKVMEHDRELVTAEVEALEFHLNAITKAQYAVDFAGELAKKALLSVFNSSTKT